MWLITEFLLLQLTLSNILRERQNVLMSFFKKQDERSFCIKELKELGLPLNKRDKISRWDEPWLLLESRIFRCDC